jgi:hypothetical protein
MEHKRMVGDKEGGGQKGQVIGDGGRAADSIYWRSKEDSSRRGGRAA